MKIIASQHNTPLGGGDASSLGEGSFEERLPSGPKDGRGEPVCGDSPSGHEHRASKGKIVAFDSWTGGAANIERLVDALGDLGIDLLLIHVGSWGHDPARPMEERIGKLLARDITYYGTKSLVEILQTESPDAVVFLSTQAFVHRAVNRYCSRLGIPTLHLYHGVVGVQSLSAKRLNPMNPKSQISLIRSRARRNVLRIWPIYARALWDTRASLRDWGRFAYDVWLQVDGRSYVGKAAADTKTTACCVYTEADVLHAVERYSMPRESVFTVGNPDLLRFGLEERDLGACLTPVKNTTSQIVYIDTALIEIGSSFDGPRAFVEHLRETSEAIERQGFKLVVKLHPAHSRTGVLDLLEDSGIEQCRNGEFVPRLKRSCAAIAEPSSAALIPALLGLPVLLARYAKLGQQEYGEVLLAYPRARILQDLEMTLPLLAEAEGVPDAATRAWIAANAGPLPAEEMPWRVADVLSKIAGPSGALRASGRSGCRTASPAAKPSRE